MEITTETIFVLSINISFYVMKTVIQIPHRAKNQ